MADSKITQLTELTTPAGGDLLAIVDDPSGTPITKKSTVPNILALGWPVGSEFLSLVSTNPATVLGFGTWSAIGAGRVLVGQDTGDTDFDVLEETGGAKTVTLATAEIPAHTHTQDAHNHTQDSHNHTQDAHTHTQDAHLHQTLRERSATTGAATTLIARTSDTSSTVDTGVNTENATATNQNATATNQAATATNQAATATNQNTGGGGAHANVQPYVVVYLWKRTA